MPSPAAAPPPQPAPLPLPAPSPPPLYAPAPRYAAPAPRPTDVQIAAMGQGRFIWPVRGDVVRRFAPRGERQANDGIDIRAAGGAAVTAAAAGEVAYVAEGVASLGNLVLVRHPGGWITAYAHLGAIKVAERQHVTQGQLLGSVGVSGGLAEPALHFEVRYAATPGDRAVPVDPMLVLSAPAPRRP